MDKKHGARDVIIACNDLIDCKVLFTEDKIQKILEEIASSSEVYNLIADCLSVFNRDKEFDRVFNISGVGKGNFVMPKEEAKIIAFVFCLLVDINSGKINYDKLIARYFLSETGEKDYKAFMGKVIVPFRNLISEAFGDPVNVTTVEAIENMEENVPEEDQEVEQERKLGENRFSFTDQEALNKTFETARAIAEQIYNLLEEERKIREDLIDSRNILNSIVIACDKKDFEMLDSLVDGLKYSIRGFKSVKFLAKELCDIIGAQYYNN